MNRSGSTSIITTTFVILCLMMSAISFANTTVNGDVNNSYAYYVDNNEERIKRGIEETVSVVAPNYDSKVRSYLVTYLERNREHSERILGKAELYFPMFEQYLEAYGLPTDLKYMAIIESALEPLATSSVGAAGMWQFMRGTGIWMGLRITKYVDERRDPEKSTEAAVRYLKKLYEEFGSWELAMCAYNAGPGRVRYAIRRSGSRDFWKLRRYLPRETRSYVPGFIAANYLFANPDDHGLSVEQLDDEMLVTTNVQLFDGMSFYDVNSVTGVSVNTLRRLNPMFSRRYVPKSSHGYTVKVPAHAAPTLLVHLGVPESQVDSITSLVNGPNYQTPIIVRFEEREVTDVYRVVKGDNLYRIAQSHGCTVNQLVKWNNLATTNLSINQRLRIKSTERVAVYADVEVKENNRLIPGVDMLPSSGALRNAYFTQARPDIVHLFQGDDDSAQYGKAIVLKRRMSLADALIINGIGQPSEESSTIDSEDTLLTPGAVVRLRK